MADASSEQVSDTGQISINSTQRSFSVITPRTEAIAFAGALPHKMRLLKVLAASGPALLAASALDGNELEQSRRILLILATDARNTDMAFADRDDKELARLGKLPVLIRTGRYEVGLQHARAGKLALYALRLNGTRAQKLRLKVVNGSAVAVLDTAALDFGPTTYFELLEE
jgi:hypothetical protein